MIQRVSLSEADLGELNLLNLTDPSFDSPAHRINQTVSIVSNESREELPATIEK
jgi:hypothetical protein